MKRKIFLVRHGESTDKQTGQTDFDRSLTLKGKISVELLGKFFKDEHLSPKCVVASPAVRTKETATILSNATGFSIEAIEYDALLYNGSDEYYGRKILQSMESLMLVGHNPAISYVIGKITGDYSISLQPGQCALLEIDDERTKASHTIKLIGPFHK